MLKTIYISYDGVLEPLGQSQILSYLKGLSKKNIKIYLISFEKPDYAKDYDKVLGLKKELHLNGIEWVKLGYHKKPQVISTLRDVLYGLIVIIGICLRERPSIVHGRSYVASLIAWILKKVFSVKFVFDMRGFWADERVEGRIWKKKGNLYRFTKFIERCLLKDADEVIVLTNGAKDVLKDWGYPVENISVIPSCVDIERFVFNNNARNELRSKYNLTGKFIFLHTGSLEYWYMKEKMLDYFISFVEFLQDAHFLILSNNDPEKIKKLITNMRIDSKYFTVLSVPFEKMPEYISMADAGIFFITPVFSKLASSPTKFAEYLSCGLPVVINDKIGNMEEYVVKNDIGIVIRNFCDKEYTQSFPKLLTLIKDKSLRFRCRAVACADFNVKKGADSYYQIYTRLS